MNRDPSMIRRVVLVGLTLSFAACGTGSGAPEAADTPDLEAATALRERFPQQAAQVLKQEERFESNKEGLALKPVQGGSWRSLELTLPHDAAGSAHMRVPGGFDVRVREVGARGEVRVTESAVSYQRAGGTSFWKAAPGGYEEWLHLSGVGAGAAIASWEIEGAVVTQLGDEVAVVDERGVPRILVSAPAAYAEGGRRVTARLKGEGATIELFVDATGEVLVDPLWNAAQTMHRPRYGHTATLLPNGTVLVAGGKVTTVSGDTWDETSEVYDPSTNLWGDPKPMSVGRYAHNATLLLDGKVLVTGGMNGGGFLNVGEVYDSFTNSWAVVQPMNAAHHSHTATLLGNGKVLVVGGIPENGVPEVYDPADQSFHLTGDMVGTLLQSHTATLLENGKVLVAGGGSVVGGNFLTSTALYDPSTDTWAAGPSMSTARADHTATKFANGTVLMTGGRGAGGMLTSAELYRPFDNSWSSVVGAMSTARSGHTATLLQSGKVLVAGGFFNMAFHSTDTAELFDPTTNVWTSTGSMSIARVLHTATRLPSGAVLVTGGFGIQASTELYTEPAIPPSPLSAAPVCLSLRRGAQGSAFDAMINQEAGHTANNYGSLSLLTSGVIGGTQRHSLYRWDLSLVPPGAKVLNAGVVFNVSSNGSGAPQVHQITEPWDEHTVSWDNFNGAFNPVAVGAFNNGYPASPKIILDVLPTAKGWVDGSIPNYGLLVEQAGPSYTRIKSSEWGVGSLRPTLNLCYQLACAPGFADCDGDGANGCEASLSGAANCGGCGVSCSGGASCVGGACVAPSCTGRLALPEPAAPPAGELVDLNGDGQLDRITGNGSMVRVVMNLGNATFAAPVDYPAGPVIGIKVVDLNGDGRPDLAVTNPGAVSVLMNLGNGTFAAPFASLSVPFPRSFDAADLNGDGEPDLAIINDDGDYDTDNTISVLMNQGGGNFAPSFSYVVGKDPLSIFAADLNGDGNPDLAVADRSSSTVSTLLNNGDGSFAPKVDYWAGWDPSAFVVSDLNGDGKPDFAVSMREGNGVSVLLNNGDGTLAPRTDHNVGGVAYSIAAADLNGDGKTDLAVWNASGISVSVLINQGNGTFPSAFPAGIEYAVQIAAGSEWGAGISSAADLNGDGRPDFVVHASDGEHLLLNNGDGTFPSAGYYFQARPMWVGAADFDGNGKPDLAVATVDSVSVLMGQGNGVFATKVDYPAGQGPFSAAATDLNGDGKPDLAVANVISNNVSVLLNQGNGTFAAPLSFSTGERPYSVVAVDLNGDGKPDLATANSSSNDVSVLLNQGNGAFSAKVDYAAGAFPYSITSADLNGDGKLDLAVANFDGNTVSVLMNQGNGAFAAKVDYAVNASPTGVTAADLNGDGKPDLALSNGSVLLNQGNGTFSAGVSYVAAVSHSVTSADLNGDGKPDLALSNGSVLLNQGNGTFGAAIVHASGVNPWIVTAADLDGDGRPDLAINNIARAFAPELTYTVTVLLNTCHL